MTSGPDHYREAERLVEQVVSLLEQAVERGDKPAADSAITAVPLVLQRAQVHATLALTAATAIPVHERDGREPWREALS